MGSRKHNTAVARKEAKKNIYMAQRKGVPTSPRKMRLVADLIRGLPVERALQVLKLSDKAASVDMEKTLLAAIASWQSKNEDANIEDAGLYIDKVYVDSASMLKRIQPAPQGRAHRIRKRSNHITLILGTKNTSK
jgi:large subunit ribosomal protein L22